MTLLPQSGIWAWLIWAWLALLVVLVVVNALLIRANWRTLRELRVQRDALRRTHQAALKFLDEQVAARRAKPTQTWRGHVDRPLAPGESAEIRFDEPLGERVIPPGGTVEIQFDVQLDPSRRPPEEPKP